MNTTIERVAESLIAAGHEPRSAADLLPRNLQQGYRYFLSLCDGGYTADNFLHFFGLGQPGEHNLLQWNVPGLRKQHFGLDEQSFVFAEDILGTQFLFDVRGNRRVVKMLIPDGGRVSLCANTFEEFLENEVASGHFNAKPREAAKRFFLQKRLEFRPFTHISCKIPGMLGGSDEAIQNLTLSNSATNLSVLGQIFVQLKSIPPGTKIEEVTMDERTGKVRLIPPF